MLMSIEFGFIVVIMLLVMSLGVVVLGMRIELIMRFVVVSFLVML